MNISHFDDPVYGIKGVTQEEINSLSKICDAYGQIPFSGADINHYYYPYDFSVEEWKQHTEMCDFVVNNILNRVKYLPDKIDHFDWWQVEQE